MSIRDKRSSKLLVEPPASAIGDIAFILIVFFLVCASTQPDAGRRQTIPKADEQQEEQKEENLEVLIARDVVSVNGNPTSVENFPAAIAAKLRGKTKDEDRVVVVTSKPETSYTQWIRVTSMIQDAGGIITLQIKEEQEVTVE